MDQEVGGDLQVEQMDTTGGGVRQANEGEDGSNNKRDFKDGRTEEASGKDIEESKIQTADTLRSDDKGEVGGDASKTEEKVEGSNVKDDHQEDDSDKKAEVKEGGERRVESPVRNAEEADDAKRAKKRPFDQSPASGDAEEGKKGELEKPVIVEGKRKRHTVERMVINADVGTRKPKPAVPGQGTALGDIPYVREAFDKFKGPMLQGLFRLCFGRQGSRQAWKKELRRFNGFPFDENDVQFQRRKATAQKFSVDDLKNISSILGIERAPVKSDMVTNILSFLLKPKDLGKSPGLLGKRKKGSKKRKRQTKKEQKKGTY
ncbi:unnamed protein product [Toxocara canis]|uniref:DEK_C domain-containing protein n=1 Tax=Toxocara canis TaxID=6265 RepID=A0A183VBT4_TOXCA|nr:unnamed protein product [Toxocara canis]